MTHKNCDKSLAADCCIRNVHINCLRYSILHLTTVKILNTIVLQEKSYVILYVSQTVPTFTKATLVQWNVNYI